MKRAFETRIFRVRETRESQGGIGSGPYSVAHGTFQRELSCPLAVHAREGVVTPFEGIREVFQQRAKARALSWAGSVAPRWRRSRPAFESPREPRSFLEQILGRGGREGPDHAARGKQQGLGRAELTQGFREACANGNGS